MRKLLYLLLTTVLAISLSGCGCNHLYSDWERGSGGKEYRICSKCQNTEWRSDSEAGNGDISDNDSAVTSKRDETKFSKGINAEKKLIGQWSAEVLFIEGEPTTDRSMCSQVTADFSSDSSGVITIAKDDYNLDWEYYKTDDDMIYYRMYMGNDYRNIGIVTETGHDYYGYLIVYLDDETTIIFEKD